jgi:hypothetical protein
MGNAPTIVQYHKLWWWKVNLETYDDLVNVDFVARVALTIAHTIIHHAYDISTPASSPSDQALTIKSSQIAPTINIDWKTICDSRVFDKRRSCMRQYRRRIQ